MSSETPRRPKAHTYLDMYLYDVVYPDSVPFERVFNTVNPTAIKSLSAFLHNGCRICSIRAINNGQSLVKHQLVPIMGSC